MAKLDRNSPLQGIRGTLGRNLIFRRSGDQTIVSMKPKCSKKSSIAQKETREKFREATAFSKAQMNNPIKKEYYRKIAKRLNLPNAYTAAITEYMRGPVISDVQLKRSRDGKVKMRVKACKENFSIEEVKIRVLDKKTNEATYIAAKLIEKNVWICELKYLEKDDLLEAFVYDSCGNYSRKWVKHL